MKKRSFLPVIGLLLFSWIILNVDAGAVLAAISGADMNLVALTLLLIIPNVLIKALKWKVIIGSYGVSYPLLRSARAWIVGFFLGLVTPGRIGDLSRAIYLRKEAGVGTGKSLATVIVDRITDIAILFCMALLGAAVFAGGLADGSYMMIYVSAFFAAFVAAVFILTRKGLVGKLARPFSRLVPEKYRSGASSAFHGFYSGVGEMSVPRVTAAMLLSTASWVISISQFWMLSLSLGLDLGFMFFVAAVPVVVLLEILPVSFSGIGTREAALIFFFSIAGIASEPAVSLSIMAFIFVYMSSALVGLSAWAASPGSLSLERTVINPDKKPI